MVVSPDSDLQFGLARMFASYASIHDLTVAVFTDLEVAVLWIRSSDES